MFKIFLQKLRIAEGILRALAGCVRMIDWERIVADFGAMVTACGEIESVLTPLFSNKIWI